MKRLLILESSLAKLFGGNCRVVYRGNPTPSVAGTVTGRVPSLAPNKANKPKTLTLPSKGKVKRSRRYAKSRAV